MHRINFQTVEETENFTSPKSECGRDKAQFHDLLCPPCLLFFYLSVTCLFPRVQRKCSLHFLTKASGEHPPVIYLLAGVDCAHSKGGFLHSSTRVTGFWTWPLL